MASPSWAITTSRTANGPRHQDAGRAGRSCSASTSLLAVTDEQLLVLMDVRRPDTGDPLRRAGRRPVARRCGDSTRHSPRRSRSAPTWALAQPQLRVSVRAPRTSRPIDRALGYATRQVPMLRHRGDHSRPGSCMPEGGPGWLPPAGGTPPLVPLPIRSRTRSCTRMSCCTPRSAATAEVVAIDSRTWLQHQREVGAAYRTELARELTTLGFQIERGTGPRGAVLRAGRRPTAAGGPVVQSPPPGPGRDPRAAERDRA